MIADWVELHLAVGLAQVVTDALVRRAESVREDPENGVSIDPETGDRLEEEILESQREQLVEAVWQELHYRQRVLGATYPFVVKPRGPGWVVTKRQGGDAAVKAARLTYLFCLLDSGLRYGLIVKLAGSEDVHSELVTEVPQQFQALSYFAAHDLVGGKAHWFGWPRPDGSNFPEALKRMVSVLGHGKVKEKAPAYSTGAEKDGTIDLVVWRTFSDSLYGSCIVYGQVASGSNWRGKPIKSFITGRFFDWFDDRPSEQYISALFIPFPLHEQVKEKKGYSFEEVLKETARAYEMDFGMIIDRLRLTELVYGTAAQAGPAQEEFRKWGLGIIRWMSACRQYAVEAL